MSWFLSVNNEVLYTNAYFRSAFEIASDKILQSNRLIVPAFSLLEFSRTCSLFFTFYLIVPRFDIFFATRISDPLAGISLSIVKFFIEGRDSIPKITELLQVQVYIRGITDDHWADLLSNPNTFKLLEQFWDIELFNG